MMRTQVSPKSVNRAFDRLKRLMPDKVAAGKPLAKYTTLRVGGPAAIFAVAEAISDLRFIVETINDYELPSLILGRGSNLLVSDQGFPGIVFQLSGDFTHITVNETEVRVGGGVSLTSLVQTAMRHNLDGLAFAVGIPGTVGAALALNAGAHGGDMAGITKSVVYYSPDCRLRTAPARELGFDYRSCRLPKGAVILEVYLNLTGAPREAIKSQMEVNLRRRKFSQPLDLPSAGSMFKNPPNDFAGRLIEAAGCKGLSIGGAQVSNKHANIFVNTGGATATDFYLLMREAKSRVKEKFEVELEPEIRLVGDWPNE